MFPNIKKTVILELENLINSHNIRPYVFRTRLERVLMRASILAVEQAQEDTLLIINDIKDKLNYISDQSNQTSDGTVKSFCFLEPDLKSLYLKIIA